MKASGGGKMSGFNSCISPNLAHTQHPSVCSMCLSIERCDVKERIGRKKKRREDEKGDKAL